MSSMPCHSLKCFFSEKIGGLLSHCHPPKKHKMLNPELERKMAEAMKQRAMDRNRSFKSMNSIIMRFPQFREGLTNTRDLFDQFDENRNGTIDLEELKKCLGKLQIRLTEKEIDDLYHSCNVDGNEGIQYHQFIVLLCIIYLLTSTMRLPQLEPIFEPIIEAFLFLDKNFDGKLRKRDIVRALNDAAGWERSPRHITSTRFKEMDWTRSGTIGFKEFLFTFTDWVGIGGDDDMEIPITYYGC